MREGTRERQGRIQRTRYEAPAKSLVLQWAMRQERVTESSPVGNQRGSAVHLGYARNHGKQYSELRNAVPFSAK